MRKPKQHKKQNHATNANVKKKTQEKSIKYTRSRTRSFTIASERTERKKVPQGHFDGKHAANQMEGEEKIDKNKKDGRK